MGVYSKQWNLGKGLAQYLGAMAPVVQEFVRPGIQRGCSGLDLASGKSSWCQNGKEEGPRRGLIQALVVPEFKGIAIWGQATSGLVL